MKLTLEEKLAHGGQPVLHWMMDNILVRTDLLETLSQTKKNPVRKLMVLLPLNST
jgi:phage terminase large subunit-like protein